jgi:hypothetical protein
MSRRRGAELETIDASLLDIVDHVLTKGVVITGDLVLGVADIDLVYLRLSAVLCAADRVFGKSAKPVRPSGPRREVIAATLGQRRAPSPANPPDGATLGERRAPARSTRARGKAK